MQQSYEVIIIGGSYAGLSAALALGRSLRRTLVIDAGDPCNKSAPASHNFLTHDGAAPAEIGRMAREEVLQYKTVAFLEDSASAISGADGDFRVSTHANGSFQTKKVVFATGLHDELPDIPGVRECWGKSVIHCPYCHGYEVRHQPTGILMNSEHTLQMVNLIRNWTEQLTLFTNGPATIDRDKVAATGTRLVEQPIDHLLHDAGQLRGICLTDGSEVDLRALYLHPVLTQKCPLPAAMGCELADNGTLWVDEFSMTTVPGIYAAGDCTTHMRAVSYATGGGTLAGAMVNHGLVIDQSAARA
ncbi:thioredoxin reductase [Neolewinella xylanilytica]|uniref:Thioredoxin reductase n=1 Tax=Neolewinella xylanilytica TaxID=1514080 RepID=A0A2S6IAZ3_9BACT|nr:NAD(P)/FAD-dependent oxidoreductase [Neolewinella xylanilytica]PPK88668.1 thioredoxin reductase [Neolewinella xylanilytica]